MALDTTFAIFQQLLKDAVDADPTLTDTLKVTLKLRVDELSVDQAVQLHHGNAESVAGNVSLDPANAAILVASGAPGTPNRVVFEEISFGTPVRIVGADGPFGALVGHLGEATDPAVVNADMSLQYRLSSTGTWVNFTRNTIVDETSTIQFALDIADQGAGAAVPQLFLIAQQL